MEDPRCRPLVIAHAGYGHNLFSKNNYLFRSGSDADLVIDYLEFARNTFSNARIATASTRWRGVHRQCARAAGHGWTASAPGPDLAQEQVDRRTGEARLAIVQRPLADGADRPAATEEAR